MQLNTSEALVSFYQTTRRGIPEDSHIHWDSKTVNILLDEFKTFTLNTDL
jgi:hypothetical protein